MRFKFSRLFPASLIRGTSQPQQATTSPASCYNGGITLTGVTLFGVVSETTPNGQAPLADQAELPTRSACLPSGAGWREVTINGDTRFDMELVRQ